MELGNLLRRFTSRIFLLLNVSNHSSMQQARLLCLRKGSQHRQISWLLCPLIEDFSKLVKEVEREKFSGGFKVSWKQQEGERSSGSL